MPTAPLFEFAKVIFEFGNPSLIEALRFSKSTRRVPNRYVRKGSKRL